MQHVCGAMFYPDFHPTPHTATTRSSHQPLELSMNDFFELRVAHIKGTDRANERRAGHNSLMSRENAKSPICHCIACTLNSLSSITTTHTRERLIWYFWAVIRRDGKLVQNAVPLRYFICRHCEMLKNGKFFFMKKYN